MDAELGIAIQCAADDLSLIVDAEILPADLQPEAEHLLDWLIANQPQPEGHYQ